MQMTPTPASAQPEPDQPATIKLVSHSLLFYWWPVWVFGFVLGWLSLLSGERLAIVPEGTKLQAGPGGSQGKTYELVLPDKARDHLQEDFNVAVMASKNAGMLFCCVLLAVIFSTTIPLRGLWSALVLMLFLIVAILLVMAGLREKIVDSIGHLHIYITAAGYLFLSAILFLVWLVTVCLFDPRRYIIFSPGQIVVHREVGDMRQVYDTTNVSVEKQRSDFFRHVLLGFFSGDIVVSVQGNQGQTFLLPNVLFAAWKVKQVANLMKTRPVISEA